MEKNKQKRNDNKNLANNQQTEKACRVFYICVFMFF